MNNKKLFFSLFIAGVILLSIFLCACEESPNEAVFDSKINDETSSNEQTDKYSNFLNNVQGYWAKIDGEYKVIDFIHFDNDYIYSGTYEGHSYRDGQIKNVIQDIYDTTKYTLELYSPAIYDDWNGEYIPEETNYSTFYFYNNYLVSNDEEYFYCGKSLDLIQSISFILQREIFVFKKDFPKVYTSILTDINNADFYKNNWCFKDVINNKNFKNMSWQNLGKYKEVTFISFAGESRMDSDNRIKVTFEIQEGATIPIVVELEAISNGETSIMSIDDFSKQGFSTDESIVYADAAISTFIALLG